MSPGHWPGLFFGVYQKDGRIDFILGNHNQGYKLYRNTSDNTHRWLQFEVTADDMFDRGATGTRIKLLLDDGAVLMRHKAMGSSIGSTHQPGLHCGLGARMSVSAEIAWANSEQQNLRLKQANQMLTIRYRLPEEYQ